MSFRSTTGIACGGVLLLLGGIMAGPLGARPIEFSEPAETNQTSNVSSLGIKTPGLPGIEDRIMKPHVYTSSRGKSFTMRPAAAPPPPARKPGPFDLDDSWMKQSPDKILMKMWERETLKLPGLETDNKLSPPSGWDPFSNNAKKTEAGSDVRTNLWDFNRRTSADPFNLNESVLRLSERPKPDASLNPLEALEDRRPFDAGADYRKPLVLPLPILPANSSRPTVPANAYISHPENLDRQVSGLPRSFLEIPKAPMAPLAPMAPGQNSLTPSVYTPTKPKPAPVTAPRRSY